MYKTYFVAVSIFIILFNLIYQPPYNKIRTNDIYVEEEQHIEIANFNL
jgi:hypothetical protein